MTTQILIKETLGQAPVFVTATEIELADKTKQGLVFKTDNGVFLVPRCDDLGNELPAHKFSNLKEALRFAK